MPSSPRAHAYDAVRDHEQLHESGAPTDTVMRELQQEWSEETARDALETLKKQGEIYSPDGGDHYRITDRTSGVA